MARFCFLVSQYAFRIADTRRGCSKVPWPRSGWTTLDLYMFCMSLRLRRTPSLLSAPNLTPRTLRRHPSSALLWTSRTRILTFRISEFEGSADPAWAIANKPVTCMCLLECFQRMFGALLRAIHRRSQTNFKSLSIMMSDPKYSCWVLNLLGYLGVLLRLL